MRSLYTLDHKPEFPKLKYAPNGGAVMVQTRHEELALGLGWSDNDTSPRVEVPTIATEAKKGAKK